MIEIILESTYAAWLAGFSMMFLTTNQHVNSANNRYFRAFPTSLLISCVAYLHIKYAVQGDIQYILFALGAALGSTVGVYTGNKK